MANPVYLQIGDVIVEDFSGTATGYFIDSASLPEPDPDGYGGHLPALREFTLRVEGTTKSAVRSYIAALRRECVRDKSLYWQTSDTATMLECRIRDASVVEHYYDPLLWDFSVPATTLTVSLTTDPYWLAPWTDETDVSSTVTTAPGHFDVTGVPGEVGALVRLRAVPVRWGFGLAVGIKYDPATGYDHLDDYGDSGDTSDASALGTYREDTTMTGTAAVMGTTPTLDTNGNRGRHLVLARMMTDATPAAVSVYMNTTTTGSAIADSVTVDELAMTLPQTGIRTYEMGTVQVPAGQVPDIDTGTGYADPTIDEQQTTEDADTGAGIFCQTVALTKGHMLDSIKLKTGSTVSGTTIFAQVYEWTGTAYGDFVCGFRVGTLGLIASTEYTLTYYNGTAIVPATGTYAIKCWEATTPQINLRKNSAGGYASGTLYDVTSGSFVDTSDDLYFKLYTRIPLTFDTTTAVMASCSESSKTLGLDFVQRIPLDDAAIVYRRATNGVAAMLYDGDTDTPYVADADGIGPAVYDKTEIRKPLRFAPGVTNRVVLGILQNADSVQGWTVLSYSYRPRYLTATGGDAS